MPVYATQGANGGIALLENYSLSKALLSDKESESILFALKTLQATKYPEIDTVLDKLGAIFRSNETDWIQIDFSPWGSDPNQYNKMTYIKNAILNSQLVEFDYISASNIRSRRKLEPLRLIFKGLVFMGMEQGADTEAIGKGPVGTTQALGGIGIEI